MATSTTNSFSPSIWHAAYPAPTSTPTLIRREEVLEMVKQSAESSGRDFVLVDLRGNDYQVTLIFVHTLYSETNQLK